MEEPYQEELPLTPQQQQEELMLEFNGDEPKDWESPLEVWRKIEARLGPW